jgi:uncharacterized protein
VPTRNPDNPDGYFELYYRDGYAHLTVFPPGESGRPVYREDVQNRMKLLQVPRVSGAEIAELIEGADGQPHRLVEWPDGRKLASVITVSVNEDGLSATVHVTEPKRGALPPTIEDVVTALETAGVQFGTDRDEIARMLADRNYGQSVVVAAGTPPVHARAGEINYHFNTRRGKPYLMMEYGRINLKELNFIENKIAGAFLAELLPEVKPTAGRAVTGDTLRAETAVEPVVLVAGQNTEITDGGTEIHATADGNVRLLGDAVMIEPVVSVESVNYETGNITFDGSVVVEKSIADGFVIEAGGDVQVTRGVGRATIIAGGNVLLKSGINGGGEGRIECGGSLVAKYIEGSVVTCTESLFVEEAIMHSELAVGKHCVLTGKRAEIMASDLIVGGSLWCKKLGNVAESPANVSIGIPPQVLIEYRQAGHEIELASDALEKNEEQLRQITRSLTEGKSDPRLGQAKEQLENESVEIEATIKEIRNNARQLRDRLEAAKNSMLVAEDTIFNGSVVSFGRAEWRPPTQGASQTILRHRHGEIQESGYNPAERPEIDFEDKPDDIAAPADAAGAAAAGADPVTEPDDESESET